LLAGIAYELNLPYIKKAPPMPFTRDF
jgi:hypothetical protein